MAQTARVSSIKSPLGATLRGTPAQGLALGTWGFFVGFAAVALYGPAAKYFQEQMRLGGLAVRLLAGQAEIRGVDLDPATVPLLQ